MGIPTARILPLTFAALVAGLQWHHVRRQRPLSSGFQHSAPIQIRLARNSQALLTPNRLQNCQLPSRSGIYGSSFGCCGSYSSFSYANETGERRSDAYPLAQPERQRQSALPASRRLPMLHLAGKALRRRRPVSSALGRTGANASSDTTGETLFVPRLQGEED